MLDELQINEGKVINTKTAVIWPGYCPFGERNRAGKGV